MGILKDIEGLSDLLSCLSTLDAYTRNFGCLTTLRLLGSQWAAPPASPCSGQWTTGGWGCYPRYCLYLSTKICEYLVGDCWLLTLESVDRSLKPRHPWVWAQLRGWSPVHLLICEGTVAIECSVCDTSVNLAARVKVEVY